MTYKIFDKNSNKIVHETHYYDDAVAYLLQDYENLVFIKD
jgi:hypothetical protein